MEITLADVRAWLPSRPRAAHKGTFGHLFIVAGSRGFTGAARLACEGALRSGVGLVTAGVPRPLADLIAMTPVESMSLPMPATEAETFALEALDEALAFATTKQAVVLGPGLSQHPETQAFATAFMRRCPVSMLVDADGLNALSAQPDALNEAAAPRVLTPHPGEMARLLGQSTADIQTHREEAAREAAARYGCVAVLKGHRTVVAGPAGDLRVNTTGNAGLAKGGTGDVLSGLVGGLMAQGIAPREAACIGVYVHGFAGDLAAVANTQRGMTAMDVVAALPEAWRAVEEAK